MSLPCDQMRPRARSRRRETQSMQSVDLRIVQPLMPITCAGVSNLSLFIAGNVDYGGLQKPQSPIFLKAGSTLRAS